MTSAPTGGWPPKVVEAVKATLELPVGFNMDEIPAFLYAGIQGFLETNPKDTSFLLECAEPDGDPSKGGKGYGELTCMEDGCWEDMNLGPDPSKPDGGLADGLGSFDEFRKHCLEEEHQKRRTIRLRRELQAAEKKEREIKEAMSNPSPRKLGKNTSMSQAMLSKALASTPEKKKAGMGSASTSQAKPKPTIYSISSSSDEDSDIQRIVKKARVNPNKVHKTLGVKRPPPRAIYPISSSDSEQDVQPYDSFGSSMNRKPLVPTASQRSNGLGASSSSGSLGGKGKGKVKDEEEDVKPASLNRFLAAKPDPDDVIMLSDTDDEDVKPFDGKPKLTAAETKEKKKLDIELNFCLQALSSKRDKPLSSLDRRLLIERSHWLQAAVDADVPPPYTAPHSHVTKAYGPEFLQHRSSEIFNARLYGLNASSSQNVFQAGREVKPLPNRFGFQDPAANAIAGPSRQAHQPYELPGFDPYAPAQPAGAAVNAKIAERIAALRAAHAGPSAPGNAGPMPGIQPGQFGANPPPAAQSGLFKTESFLQRMAAGMAAAANHVATGVQDAVGMMVDGAQDLYGGRDLEDEMHRYMHGVEPRMAPSELQKFFEDNLDSFQENETVQDACAYLGLENMSDMMHGMDCTLMPHQVISVAWLLKKERDEAARGGLLLDAMGLGKTISCIATMVANQSADPKCKTTLIVAPLALLRQWEQEIMTKTCMDFQILIYHGANKPKKIKTLQQFDVILTTYGTLVTEFPKKEKRKRKKPASFIDDDAEEDDYLDNTKQRAHGPLARMEFWRVILDESHTIRNRGTQAAKACFELESVHRISATGTLIVNTVEDVFSHLHFVGVSNLSDWDTFRMQIASVAKRNPKLATKRLQATLKVVALRRTKDSQIDGKPILTLPEKTVDVVEYEFTEEERQIYHTVESRAVMRFNRFLKAGTVMKNYSQVLTMILRLRQCVLHPKLLTRKKGEIGHHDDQLLDADDVLTGPMGLDDEYSEKKEIQKAIKIGGEGLVKTLQEKLLQRSVDLAAEDSDETDRECPICKEILGPDEIITKCCHFFCRDCIQNVCEAAGGAADMNDADANRRMQGGIGSCPICRTDVRLSEVFYAKAFAPPEDVGSDDDETEDEEEDVKPRRKYRKTDGYFNMGMKDEDSDGSQAEEEEDEKPWIKDDPDVKPDVKPKLKKSKKSKGKGKAKMEDEEEEEEGEEKEIVPSTKMRQMMEQLQQWLAEAPDTKILVFSQFTSFLKMVSNYLSTAEIEHDLYMGSMSRTEREDVIKYFTKPNSCRVLLVSLKSGGVGLNLTIANKVINLDLAWNAATEDQAVDRVHRIGQTKPVSVKRIVIQDSIEQRILALQEKKKALANGALGEGGAGKLGRLNLQDLIGLFTMSGHGVAEDD